MKISDIPSRNSETNNSKREGQNLKPKVNLSKKEIIEATPPHSKVVQFQLHKSNRITVMDLRQETIKTEGLKPLPDVFQFVGIS
jgi:hypothetical protein